MKTLIWLVITAIGSANFSIVNSATVRTEIPDHFVCECRDAFARFSFEVRNGQLVKVLIVDSSGIAICDDWYARHLATRVVAQHPDGVIGTGVIGLIAADAPLAYEQCMEVPQIEVDVYWYVEEIVVDLDKIGAARTDD